MADNIFITAFIGGGKSLCGVRFICNELLQTERLISTSLPIFVDDHWQVVPKTKRYALPTGLPGWWLPEAQTREIPSKPESMELWVFGLATWCHNEIKKPVNLNNRLRLLRHEEIPKFYLHLPNQDLPELTHNLPGRRPVVLPDLTARTDSGCLFIIDEVHIYFSARNYLESGPGVEMYQSQLRHLNDDMVMISQHLEKVDKNFRRNCTKTYELANLGNQKLWGGVTLKERFNWKLYSGVPVRGDRPIEKGSFTLREQGMCYLYDTMAGVGVSGGMKADSPPRGRHWSTWLLLVALFIVGAYMFPRLIMHGFGYGIGSVMGSIQKGVNHGFNVNSFKSNTAPKATVAPAVSSIVGGPNFGTSTGNAVPVSTSAESAASESESQPVTCSGYAFVPGLGRVAFLSDGGQLQTDDGSLILANRVGALARGGHFYALKEQIPDFISYSPPEVATAGFLSHGKHGPVSVSYIGSHFLENKHQAIYNGWANTPAQGQTVTVGTPAGTPAQPATQLQGGGGYAP